MTEISRFWDGTSTGDATSSPYDAATEFAQVMSSIALAASMANRSGVWLDELAALQVTRTAANTASVYSGRAMVYGGWYQNDTTVNVSIPTPGGATRIDRIVVRKSWASQTIRITRIAGAEGGGAPSITQTLGATWDMPLAQVSITTGGVMTVTDERVIINGALSQMGYNYLINPGFDIWQRGIGPFTANNAYSADMWLISLGGSSTMSISRDSTNNVPGSWFCAAVTYTHNTTSYLIQKFEDRNRLQLRGRTFTFSMKVRASAANAVRLYVEDGINTFTGTYHSGSNSYETLTVSGTVSASASALTARVSFEASVTAYLDNAVFNLGAVPADYTPLTVAEDWAKCQRYYQILSPGGSSLIISGIATAGSQAIYVSFPLVDKQATPTVTKTGTWNLGNAAGQPTVQNAESTGFILSLTSTAAGSFFAQNNVGGATITADASP